jgi:hypothetical protein
MIGVAIIGAGVTGLTCAQALVRAGVQSVLFDKGRGIGGRVATRRAGDVQFDHGAQYVTRRGPGFAALLDDLAMQGATAHWDDGTGRQVTVGLPGMSGMAKAMAAGLSVNQGAHVTGLRQDAGAWVMQVGDATHRAPRVVVCVPAPQARALLGAGHPILPALAGVTYAPNLTLMAVVQGGAPFVSRADVSDDLAWIAQDSAKPGRPQGAGTAWVAQASPAFSAAHLEEDAPVFAARMVTLLCDRLGVGPEAVTHAVGHRWRYAQVTQALGVPCVAAAPGLWLAGDWCLGPRVEDAFDSGKAVAAEVLASLT